MRRWLAMSVLCVATAGCASRDVMTARDDFGPFVQMSNRDLISCMGNDFSFKQIGPDEMTLQWSEKTSDAGFKLTFLGTGIQVAGGGECKFVARITHKYVEDVSFAGVHNVSAFSDPYSACGPLVDECAHRAPRTGDQAYDEFPYLLDKTK